MMTEQSATLLRRIRLDSPVVEVTPVAWQDRLLILENWTTFWADGNADENRHYLRLREEASGKIVSEFMEGYAFASAIVHQGRMFVFAVKKSYEHDPRHWSTGREIYVASSRDLKTWTEPMVILSGEEQERLFNCRLTDLSRGEHELTIEVTNCPANRNRAAGFPAGLLGLVRLYASEDKPAHDPK